MTSFSVNDHPEEHVCIIWQRFLPYHVARINHLKARLSAFGCRLSVIEVSSQDISYGFPTNTKGLEHICCFPRSTYQTFKAKEIYRKVLEVLYNLKPDVVFAPATAFPEGMAPIAYRTIKNKRVVLMDDMWESIDHRGSMTKLVKRLIHRNVDSAFIPAQSHKHYYQKLGFSEDRIIYGVDVVDNEYFSAMADRVRTNSANISPFKELPKSYFLFVGRFLPRKGLATLIEAYDLYYKKCNGEPWGLVLVGSGPDFDRISKLSQSMQKVYFVGAKYGDELCVYYGLASAIIVPSLFDPWGLVINEAMASGLPVLVSTGCGAAQTLIRDGENGWKFGPGDSVFLSDLMVRLSSLSREDLKAMGNKSRKEISDWSLNRFSDGVLKAMALPRRQSASFLSDLMTFLWKGRVSIN